MPTPPVSSPARHGRGATAQRVPARRMGVRRILAARGHQERYQYGPRRPRPALLALPAASSFFPRTPELTGRANSPIPASGTPLPNEGRLSGRIDHDDQARCAAACAAFFFRPLRQTARLEPASTHRRGSGPLAPIKIGKQKLKQAIDLTREVLEVPADYRIGIVPASDTGAVEMALWSNAQCAAPSPCWCGIVRRRLADRR